jgi:3-isopropylmalate dehydrogenase
MGQNTKKIAVFPGDGVGPAVIKQAIKVLDLLREKKVFDSEISEAKVGGCAYDETGSPLPDKTLEIAMKSDAVLLGAVGGPKWEGLDHTVRPERALLKLRSELGLFANLRPAQVFKELASASSLKSELVSGVDLMVVRELTGGIYFGEPRGITMQGGERVGINTLVYKESEIRRIAQVAFEIAAKRQRRLCSVRC